MGRHGVLDLVVSSPIRPSTDSSSLDDLGDERMSRKAREDDSTKDFKNAVKATGEKNKPMKKEEKKIEKITKHLSKDEKI